MGIAERSRTRVEDLLTELERSYDAFPVNQTTLALPAARYDAARDRYAEGFVDTYVEVANDEGEILHVVEDDGLSLPGAVADPEQALERDVKREVAERTGVECTIDGVSSVTIAGLSNADSATADTLYHLLVVFDANHEEGDPEGDAEWQADATDVSAAYV
ncbi:hypothetical protein ACKVMT_15010 [Halobacteriales archaeon Cl-PHB]